MQYVRVIHGGTVKAWGAMEGYAMTAFAVPNTDQRYLQLVREFPLRPIRTNEELDRAMKIAGHLATYDEGTLPPGEQDYLDALTVFIEDYQRSHPVDLPQATPLAINQEPTATLSGFCKCLATLAVAVGFELNAVALKRL